MHSESPGTIVFFDGVCNLCNDVVDFLIRHDRGRVLTYGSLQGKTAEKLLGTAAASELSSVLLFESGKVRRESDAVLRLLWLIGGLWRASIVLRIIPAFLRDIVYRWIGKNRYRWFGKNETCRLPTPEERALFVD